MLPEEKRIKTRDQLKEVLDFELPFYRCGRLARILKVSEKAILREHQILLRKTEYHTNTHHRVAAMFYRLRLLKLQNRLALHIPINCVERGLHIMHIGSILINSNAQVGECCSLHVNTGIVAGGLNDAAPKLGKNVVMGVGAVALGDITIADFTAVGANAVVNRSVVEENTAVAGIPAHKISNHGTASWNK